MSFWKRMFSPDYRAALAAEASGDVETAAQRYGLAGERDGAVRMHLARAQRAADRNAEITALRDAVLWAGADPALVKTASRALGTALWARAAAEGIGTARDRERVREAAQLLVAGGEFEAAGEAYDRIGDFAAAAAAWSSGGNVDRVEEALAKEEQRGGPDREVGDAFASYQNNLRIGRRDEARADLARCVQNAKESAEYRRLLAELDTRLITGGRVELRRRHGASAIVCGAPTVSMGRDPLCDLILRGPGLSRRHAELELLGGGRASLRDAGSRNGTAFGGVPLAGSLALPETGRFRLGEDTEIEFTTIGSALLLTVTTGLDRGAVLLCVAPGEVVGLAPVGLAADITFSRGRPLLGKGFAREVRFAGELLGQGRIQLVRGDALVIDGEELDVA